MTLRILVSFLILFSVLFLPFWVSFLLVLFAIFYFHFFWEGILLFFISDLLYGIKEERLFNLTLLSSILIGLMLLIIEFLKTKMKFFQK